MEQPSPRPSLTRPRQAAFTIIEMLIVLGIIGMIAGLIVFNTDTLFADAERSAAESFVTNSVAAPLLQYRLHMGSYPTTEQGLQALLTPPGDQAAAARWKGPYLRSSQDILDPWERPYQYKFPGERNPNGYDIYSLGPDGAQSEDDIGNWE